MYLWSREKKTDEEKNNVKRSKKEINSNCVLFNCNPETAT